MVPDYAPAIVLLLGMTQGTHAQGGKLSPSNAWKTPIAIRAQVEGGLIAEWRVFADNEPLRKLVAKGACEVGT